MQTQNKLNATIFEMVIHNLKGIEVFAYKFEKGKPLTVYGENGAGKTAVILAIYAALDKKKIPIKYNNLVGPYSTEAIKKAKVQLGIECDKGVIELNGKTIDKFYVNFSETEKGTVNMTLTDAITGEVDKTPSREKIKNLLGLFIDPVDLAKTLEDPHGDRNLAEKVAAMVGVDFKPYILLEQELFAQKQAENIELKRQLGEFASLDVPQDDWAKEFVDPAAISKQLQDLTAVQSELIQSKKELIQIESAINESIQDRDALAESISNRQELLDEEKSNLETFREINKPVIWTGTTDIEDKIRKLTEELSLFRVHEKREQEKKESIQAKEREIERDTERLANAQNELIIKNELITKKTSEKTFAEHSHKTNMGKASEVFFKYQLPIQEPDENLSEYLKRQLASVQERMTNIERDNEQVKNREKYIASEKGIALVRQSIKNIDAKRDTNQKAKSKAGSGVKFPMEGLTIDENTVWYDSGDGRGKQTILDRSEGEQMRICTNILIAGNTGPLNVIVVRQGHALSMKSQHVIFEVAEEHGYTVILETITTEEPGAVLIEAGNVKSVIPKRLTEEKPVETVKEPVIKKSEITW